MDKRKLRTMAEMPAPPWMLPAAQKAKLRKYSLGLWYADVSGDPKEELVLRIYERSKLIGGTAFRESYRILLGIKNHGYITCVMDEKPPKCWREGRLDGVLRRYDTSEYLWFDTEKRLVDEKGYTPYISFDADGERLLEAALGPRESDVTWGGMIFRWQNRILEEKLAARHDKELEPVVELMKQIPELPEGFFEWLQTDGIARFDYAIYDPPKGKKKTRIQCTRCNADVMADVKKIHPVRDKRGTCPACGRPVTWKTATSKFDRGCSYYRWDEPWYVAIIQRMGDGIVIRYFFVDVKFILDHGNFKDRFCEWGEVARDVFTDAGGNSLAHKKYERIRYKNHGELRWAPDNGEYNVEDSFLYTENLPDVLKETVWQYSGIKEFQQKMWPKNIPVIGYMLEYPRAKYLEYFSKMGLTRLVWDALSSWRFEKAINPKGRRPDEMLMVPAQDVRALIRLNGGITMLDVLQKASQMGVRLNDEELLRFISLFGGERRRMRPVVSGNREWDIHKLLRYFRKQAEKAFDREKWNRRYTKAEALLSLEKNLWEDWDDYMGWLGRFMPECAGDEYYVLPPNLPEAHDRLMKIEHDRQKKADEKRRRRTERDVNRILAEMQETGGMGMQARGLLIRLPKDAAEIRTEGQVMHHCVATYIDRVQKGQTLILFVRKVEDPDTPFYTLEWKDGKVAQCRGMRNADMTPEVRTFVGAFERRMQKREDKPEIQQRVMVTA